MVLPVGAIGVLAGAVVNQLAWSIPRGDYPWRRGAAAKWRERSVPRPIVELTTGLLFGAAAFRFGLSWLLPAYLYFAAVGVLLCVIDVKHRVLPNVIVYPSFVIGVVLLGLAAIGDHQPQTLARAAAGALALFAFFLLSAVVTPRGVGMGDVKLAAVVGLYLGYVSWRAVVVGALSSFLVAALVGVALMLAGRAHRKANGARIRQRRTCRSVAHRREAGRPPARSHARCPGNAGPPGPRRHLLSAVPILTASPTG